ncbi:MAG: hypothetical protein ACKPKO_28100, partial [Candidatus Fonsibacter sp.]
EIVDHAEDVYFMAAQARENINKDFTTMLRSCLQRLFEVVAYKTRREFAEKTALPVATIVDAHKSVNIADNSEYISVYFVEVSIRVHKHLLSSPECCQL